MEYSDLIIFNSVFGNRINKSIQRWVTAILCGVELCCMLYMIALPALSWERTIKCTIPEHVHDESCFESIVIPEQTELVCGLETHTHGTECFEDMLCCGLEECSGHLHSEACFDEDGKNVCGLEETAGHAHAESCYETVLICQIPEHIHADECYETVREEYTDTVQICQLQEHEHTLACYPSPPEKEDGYYCGKIAHTHTESQHCFAEDGSLCCSVSEHVHTLACRSNPWANVETENYWKSTFDGTSFTGRWAEDVLIIAKSQIGYFESSRNFAVSNNGSDKRGYTRYGAWFGDPYGDWCAMFCSFCLNYAGIGENMMPYSASCENWIRSLTEKGLYHEFCSDYTAKPGDLVFLDWDMVNSEYPNARYADHVGFVYEVLDDRIITIEGNIYNCVCSIERHYSDGMILGYGELPENPELSEGNLERKNVTKQPDRETSDELLISENVVKETDGIEKCSYDKPQTSDIPENEAVLLFPIWIMPQFSD